MPVATITTTTAVAAAAAAKAAEEAAAILVLVVLLLPGLGDILREEEEAEGTTITATSFSRGGRCRQRE